MSGQTENSNTQASSRLKGMAKKTVKRLDFAIRRPADRKPPVRDIPEPKESDFELADEMADEPAPARPAPKRLDSSKPAPRPAKTMKPTPKPKPAQKPISKPAPSHGRFMDFVPGSAATHVSPRTSTPEPEVQSSVTIEREIVEVSTPARPARPAPRPARPAPRPARPAASRPVKPAASRPVKPTASRPVKPTVSRPVKPTVSHSVKADINSPVHSMSVKPATPAKPSRPSISRPFRKSRPEPVEPAKPARSAKPSKPAKPELDDEPLLDETEMNIASTFDEELDALESMSDDIFDGIDGTPGTDSIDAIEKEIEAEASEFVREPKPLFEDPLVQLSKVRDEHRQKKEAKKAAEFKEKTKEEAKKASYMAPYTLGGRSPFLTSVNVEKRPLSGPVSVADGPLAAASAGAAAGATAKSSTKSSKSSSKSAKSSGKKGFKAPKISWTAKNPDHSPVKLQAPGSVLMENSYRNQMKKQLDQDAKEIHRQTMMAAAPEDKKYRPGLIVAIVLTVLLGAGVGAVIYLIFFQQ